MPDHSINIWRKRATLEDIKVWFKARYFFGATYEELAAFSKYSVASISKKLSWYRTTFCLKGRLVTDSYTHKRTQNVFAADCFYRNDLEDIPDVSVETARANYPKDLDAWYFEREKKHLPKEVLEVLTR